jgi:hypothetical protein
LEILGSGYETLPDYVKKYMADTGTDSPVIIQQEDTVVVLHDLLLYYLDLLHLALYDLALDPLLFISHSGILFAMRFSNFNNVIRTTLLRQHLNQRVLNAYYRGPGFLRDLASPHPLSRQ